MRCSEFAHWFGGVAMAWQEALAEMSAAVSSVEDVSLCSLDSKEALAFLVELRTIRTRLDALAIRASAAPDSPILDGSGLRSAAGVISAATRADPKTIRAEVRLGVWLQGYPVMAEAFAEGRISAEHIRAIRARENPRTCAHLSEAQGYLVEAAEEHSWPDFICVLRYWELAADPDGEEPHEQVTSRSCHYRHNHDGTITGRFHLDPVAAQAFASAMEAKLQALFRHDAEADRSTRTVTQRRADALVELVCSNGGGPQAPLVHVVMGEQVLAGGTPDPWEPTSRCEFVDGTPVHPLVGRSIAANAELRRFLLQADSERMDLGRTVRGFPPHLKQALLVAARGRCQEPGCDAPVSWLQADHVIPWSRGGPTSWSNGQILCDPHNKAKGAG